MPLSVYPSDPLPAVPYEWSTYRPIASSGPAWRPVTRALTRFDCSTVRLPYFNLSWEDLEDLLTFWNSVGGANGIFMFIDFLGINDTPVGVLWENLYVCVGDSTTGSDGTAVYDLPCYDATVDATFKIYKNGTELVRDEGGGHINYTVDTTGTNGVNEITFNDPHRPLTTEIVAVTAQCRRVMLQARFVDQRFPFTLREPWSATGTLSIMEVR